MRFLVTGGAGFIGSAVCRYLVNDLKAFVTNVDRLTYASTITSLSAIADNPRYSFVHADICDREAMANVFSRFEPDIVIHLAAESHVDRSIAAAQVFLQTNIMGTACLLEAARGYFERLSNDRRRTFRFLHVSTDEVYGSLGADGLFTEGTSYDPSSPYSASKASADHLVRAWHRTYGLPTLVSNCSNNYGPYHFPEKLIPLMIVNAIGGEPLPVSGDGLNVRDWLYVEDHARALYLIATQGQVGEKYNVGGGNERSNIQVVKQICHLMDHYLPMGRPHSRLITFVSDRPGHDQRYAIDASKLERELGWRAHESFETGLEKTVRWYLDRRDWWVPLRERTSADGGLRSNAGSP